MGLEHDQPSAHVRTKDYSTWSVCLSMAFFAYRAACKQYQRLQHNEGMKNKKAIFDFIQEIWRENKQYEQCLPRPALACSAHCGGMKLLEGGVSSPTLFQILVLVQLAHV